jgi:phosphoribosyl-AMP cyclohydrolase
MPPGSKKDGELMITLDFSKIDGLVPAIAQDYQTGEVLMLAFMNREAWEETLKTGRATYYSRTRDTLWVKGLTSGHFQRVKEIRVDCDDDTVLLKVEQVGGAACHTGHKSCFYQQVMENGEIKIIGEPVFDPKEVYKK